jgi:hypothetical protein
MPHPQMNIFDAADRSVCTVRRQQTGTPLQALALLNDVQTVEAARFFAQRMLKEAGTDRVAWAFRTATGREATKKEVEILSAMLAEQRALFEKTPKDADELLTVGDGKADASLDKLDLAACTVVCLAILNHDASIMKR